MGLFLLGKEKGPLILLDVRPLVGLFGLLTDRTPGSAQSIGCKILGCPELGCIWMSMCGCCWFWSSKNRGRNCLAVLSC